MDEIAGPARARKDPWIIEILVLEKMLAEVRSAGKAAEFRRRFIRMEGLSKELLKDIAFESPVFVFACFNAIIAMDGHAISELYRPELEEMVILYIDSCKNTDECRSLLALEQSMSEGQQLDLIGFALDNGMQFCKLYAPKHTHTHLPEPPCPAFACLLLLRLCSRSAFAFPPSRSHM